MLLFGNGYGGYGGGGAQHSTCLFESRRGGEGRRGGEPSPPQLWAMLVLGVRLGASEEVARQSRGSEEAARIQLPAHQSLCSIVASKGPGFYSTNPRLIQH